MDVLEVTHKTTGKIEGEKNLLQDLLLNHWGQKQEIVDTVDVIIPFTMETQMHTTGPMGVSHLIACDVAHIVSAIHAMEMPKFGPVFCIFV